MLILIVIFLTLLIPLLMLVLNLTRWKYAFQWLLAVLGMLTTWVLMILVRHSLPFFIPGINWKPESIFPLSPVLLADKSSWAFSTALVTLGLSMVLTAIALIERPPTQESSPTEEKDRGESSQIIAANWRIWAGSMLLTSVGLVAVLSGNLLTLLLAWASLDVAELLVLLAQIQDSKGRENVLIAFSTRAAGIIMLIIAIIQDWRSGGEFNITVVNPPIAIYLLLASGLRLGVIPMHLPFMQEIPLRRSLGTILRLCSTAASLSLLVRAASAGIASPFSSYILAITALAAVFGSVMWLWTSDELAGRPYWIMGTAAMAIASAVYAQPLASLAWGTASLYAGGLIFFSSLRSRWLRIPLLVGLICLTGLPFTPTWNGIWVYTSNVAGTGMPVGLTIIFNFSFLIAHSMLIAGYLRHSIRASALTGEIVRDPNIDRWILLIYPAGLFLLPITHFLTGLWLKPDIRTASTGNIIGGIVATILGIGIWYIFRYQIRGGESNHASRADTLWTKILSLTWLYRPLWLIYRILIRLSGITRVVLEEDGGILWSIVLFLMILMLLR